MFCDKIGPTSRFINSLKGEPADQLRYSKLKSDLSHITFEYFEEKIFTSAELYANLTEWILAVNELSDAFLIDTKWMEEFKTVYQQLHTMKCNKSDCSFHMIDMAIEGSGLLHSFGLFGVKLGFNCQISDSLFRSDFDVSLLENEDSEFGLLDVDKIKDYMLIKSHLLLKPAITKFLTF
ncbi:hypothetical protein LOD99_5124 [Oopsacas minuta]|uniref:Uncharacterized protein n=1 Tax=Oopsacas minuta TaxID=111878 RepID=A0AAV7JRI3_9METZ|nr:hypothetical protein LOD99_5124 [Oopsacas minuta]